MKNFEQSNKKTFGTDCHLTIRSKIVNNKLFSLLIKSLSKIFKKYSGYEIHVTKGKQNVNAAFHITALNYVHFECVSL